MAETRLLSPLHCWLRSPLSLVARPGSRRLLHYSAPRRADQAARPPPPPLPPPYKILFCGTDTFACASLQALIDRPDLCDHLHVLTPPDTKQGWGAKRMKIAPIKQLALHHGLPHDHVPPSGLDDYQLPAILRSPASILLTCSFGHLIPTSLLASFPSPSQRLNLHPSLLPKLRGAAPLQWTIARRLDEGGVTVQTLQDGRFDAGRILGQQRLPIPGDATYLDLEKTMAQRGAELLVDVLSDLPGAERRGWDQDEAEVSFAFKVKRSNLEVRWEKWSARDIEARLRGFGYLSCSVLPSSDLGARDPHVFSLLSTSPPGTATYSSVLNSLVITTTKDAQTPSSSGGNEFLLVDRIKAQGKKTKDALEWWRGFRDRADDQGLVSFRFDGIAHAEGRK
ncbi:related to methionyl-trna formyltransferase [Pseudozyma flocculosa]|uniref:methionyl-tRNA formyltransferase n=1 Tax=Pseudozyma flocculosa TaxID=84751 RepID=A0A5C3FB05_9BASI|nr:related to methionyl-trna formyltransferase [Pseudozyma flocculosa]